MGGPRKAGAKIAFGTNAGGFPWKEINQAQAFSHEVMLGTMPIEGIRSATTVAAEMLGWQDKVGTLGSRRRVAVKLRAWLPLPAEIFN